MNDSAYSKPRETAGETAPTSTDPWFLANVLLVGFAVFPLIVFAASSWNAWKEGPAQPDPLQIAVLVVTGLVATIFAMALLKPKSNALKPKSNAEGNSMRPGFWQFLYGFFVIGLCGVFNAIFGIFTGRGPQVFFGIAVLVVTGVGATISAMALLKPKSNAEGNSMRPGFWQFLYGFFVIGLCGVFNAIFGIFTGRGPQVFFGLGFCYFLHFALLVPVYFKMRPLYRAAQP